MKMKFDKKSILRISLPVVMGGILGYAYYYFIGCRTGACPITGNPWISTIYGAIAGLIIFLPSKKKTDDIRAD